MAGGKETPRQKMIGMMYLVLTALLALNVSKEILDAFTQVDTGVRQTSEVAEAKAMAGLSVLSSSSNPEKAKPFLNKANEVGDKADELIAYINELKARTIAVSEGDLPPGDNKYGEYMIDGITVGMNDKKPDSDDYYVTKKDENQNNTSLLFGSDPQKPHDKPWSATELKGKLETYRDYLKGVTVKEVTGNTWKMPDGLKASFDEIFSYEPTMEGPKGDEKEVLWEYKNFYHMPLAALMPIMSKFQLDVENAKADVITALSTGVEGSSYKFTNLAAMVIPKSNYILRGDSFAAEILLAAYDGTNPPRTYVQTTDWNGADSSLLDVAGLEALPINERGLGELKLGTRGMGLGDHSYKGLIEYDGPQGTEKIPVYIPPFTVAEPALVVSPTAMNVFYRGLPNPVEISVPGVPQDKVQATCAGHTMSKGSNGEWIVKPGKGKDAKISVSAEIDGKKVNMGTKEFRIKNIPDPVPQFNGKSPKDNNIKLSDAQNAAGLRAAMDDFLFDVKVSVVEFTMVFTRDGQVIEKKSTSNRVTSEMQANLKKLKRGQKVYINNIMVKMPDGSKRKVANITLKCV